MFQHMNAETDMAAPALKKLSYKGFLEKFGNPADVLRQFNVAQNSLSDDEKKLGSWLCATSALAFFQAAGLEKLHNETPGEMKDYNENTVAWNLKAFAASWKLATQCLNAGDELVVPLDCPMCEGEKQVACPCCAGVKTVIDEDLGRSVPCKVCKGIGKVTCPVCNGEGKITH